jgi:hypothetical protein
MMTDQSPQHTKDGSEIVMGKTGFGFFEGCTFHYNE